MIAFCTEQVNQMCTLKLRLGVKKVTKITICERGHESFPTSLEQELFPPPILVIHAE